MRVLYALLASGLVVGILGMVATGDPPAPDESNSAVSPDAPPPVASDRELHVLGSSGGEIETDGQIHGARSFVEVNRPGKRVTLVLMAFGPLTWNVKFAEGTRCERVILAGVDKQAINGLPDGVPVQISTREKSKTPLIVPATINSLPFRAMLRQLHQAGEPRVASFRLANYAHKTGPLQIATGEADPRFSPDYPQPVAAHEIPKIEFRAHLYDVEVDEEDDQQGNSRHHRTESSYGLYTLAGPTKVNFHQSLPSHVRRVTFDPATEKCYGIQGHEVVEVDLGKGTATVMDIGLDVPELSWPSEVTFDTKRKRLLLGTSGGGGYLYAYDTTTKKWSVLCKRPGWLDAFAYSEKEDCIYGVLFEHNGSPRLARVTPDGVTQEKVKLGAPIISGSLENGPGVCPTQVVVAGERVIILAAPKDGSRSRSEGRCIYLVDPKTGDVKLTSRLLK